MASLMQAVTATAATGVALRQVPKPEQPPPGHLILKIVACAINPGDKALIGGTMPAGFFPVSQYDIYGASGAGHVVALGPGVPAEYLGKNVAVYRSLQASAHIVGTWSEYAQLPYLDCVLLPDEVEVAAYAGSLVNSITPYAFWRQIQAQGHRGILCTAGTSATGIALLGICQAYDFPLVSLVRDAAGKQVLEALGATRVVVQTDDNFAAQLQQLTQEAEATAVFDGVGGALITQLLAVVPDNTTFYCYGYLGDDQPLTMHTRALRRGLTLTRFSNFLTPTVQQPQQLADALRALGAIIHLPHFATKLGPSFDLADIAEALAFVPESGEKAILRPG